MNSGENIELKMSLKDFFSKLDDTIDDYGFLWLYADYAIRPDNISSIQLL